MNQRKQSSTSYPMTFFMADSTDHVTGKTGLTPTVTISKNGAAFGAAAGAVAEIANGWYSLAGNATDRGTLGDLALNAAAAGADDADARYVIVPWDPFDAMRMGLTALPNAAANAAGGLPISAGGGLALDTQLANTNEVTAARMGALTDWINGGRLDLLLDAIPTTAMRGTDSAALAASWTATRAGYIDELAAANLPTDVDTLLTRLSAVRAGYLDELGAANLPTDVDTLLTRLSAVRAGYLDELAAANLPADVDTLKTRLSAVNAQALADWIDGGRLDAILDTINTNAARLTAVRAAVLTDWIDNGRLDAILDAILVAAGQDVSVTNKAILITNKDETQ